MTAILKGRARLLGDNINTDTNCSSKYMPGKDSAYVAQHAFANEGHVKDGMPMRYDPTAASTAWARTTAFFSAHLGPAVRA